MHEFVPSLSYPQRGSKGECRVDTVAYKLAEGKGLREGWDSKELWKSVEKSKNARSRQLKVKTLEEPRQEKSKAPTDGARPWLKEIDHFVHGHFNVAQYGTQQAGTKRFAGVNGDS